MIKLSPMIELIFIRHPETEWNKEKRYLGKTDVALSRKGKKQSEIISKYLKKKKITAVYSSDLKRAYQAASDIAEKHSLKVKKDKRLNEIDFGAWEGLTFEQIRKKYPKLAEKYLFLPLDTRAPYGESFTSFKNRINRALKEILAGARGTIVIVGHGGVNRVIFCSLLKIPFFFFFQIKQEAGAINVIEIHKGVNVTSLVNFILWEN